MNKNTSFLNVGIVIYIIMIVLFIFLYDKGLIGTMATLLFGYMGAVIGNILRLYAMPDAYFTSGGFWGLIKAKFFWAYMPQIIGFICMLYLMHRRIATWF